MIFKDTQATIYVDLTKSEEELWKNLNKKARWGVKKARSFNLEVIELPKDKWLDFYKIYSETCKKEFLVPRSFNKLINLEKAHLFVVYFKEKLIAGVFVLEEEEKIKLYLNASLSEFLNLEPNNLLYWYIIEYGKKNNFKIFDLGGYQLNAKKETKLYEINRFKERWGGEIVKYNIYNKNPCYIFGRKIIRNSYFLLSLWLKLKFTLYKHFNKDKY